MFSLRVVATSFAVLNQFYAVGQDKDGRFWKFLLQIHRISMNSLITTVGSPPVMQISDVSSSINSRTVLFTSINSLECMVGGWGIMQRQLHALL
jgi:hypothetical protein